MFVMLVVLEALVHYSLGIRLVGGGEGVDFDEERERKERDKMPAVF